MNETPLNTFDRIAWIYDGLARLAFGRSIVNAQLHYLPCVKAKSTVLILGGGSGRVAEELIRSCPSARIWYIEASSKMILLTQQRNIPQSNITYIHGTEESIPENCFFDTIVTNFYLDLFPDTAQRKIIEKITSYLAPEGTWLVTDFEDEEKMWQRFLLKVMYSFFRTVSKIQAHALADWRKNMRNQRLTEIESTSFFGGFIAGVLYKRES